MKLPLGISLDLDNQWSYMKIHGDAGWEEYRHISIFSCPMCLTYWIASTLKSLFLS